MYLHENRVNGKKYIGITCQLPEHRWNNGKGYAKNKHFNAAIQKYGWHAFRHEILYTGLLQKDAERIEQELIAFYQTQDIDRGYNLTAGGDGVRGLVRPEARPISLGRALTGLKRPPVTRAKVSASKKEQTLGGANFGARRVRCVETGVIYPAIAEAARATGLQNSKISLCCQGKRHTTGGYHWEYYDTPIFDTQIFARKEVKENGR